MSAFQEYFAEALLKLSPKNGDIVFFDENSIDIESITKLESPSPEQDEVIFVPVRLRPGMTLAEVVRSTDFATIQSILKE
jgi:hypothetical protein